MSKSKMIGGVGLLAVMLATPILTAVPSMAAVSAAAYSISPPSGVKTTEISKTTIGLSWNAVPNAPKYRIQYSKYPDMRESSYIRTVAPSFDVRNLESNTSYYFAVRVIDATAAANSLSDYSTPISGKTQVRPVLAAIQNPLKVSSFNVKCDNCSTAPELSWADRRGAVVAQVKAEMPDVVGFQEASQGWLKDANGNQINLSQFEDLQQRLVASGTNYQLTNSHRNNCENSATPVNCIHKDQGASQGTKIIYNADTLELVDEGSVQLPHVGDTQNQRYAAWAVLRQKSSGKTFFYVNTHLEHKQDTPEFQALKAQESQMIVDTIKEKNKANLPVFIVGDMNANKYVTFGNVPWDTFQKAGYLDPLGNDYDSTYPSGKAFAENTINEEYDSFNGSDPALDKVNYPGANARHIDYIFSTPMRVAEWEMVLNKDANDNWVGVLPSDHNMIVETVELPASVSPLAAKTTELNGSLGAVTGSEVYTKTGGYQRYEGGYVIWSAATGAHVSAGPIRTEFARQGYEDGILGYPTSDIYTNADGTTFQMYQNGAIDFHPTYGAHATYGAVRTAWLKVGGTAGVLGFPDGDVKPLADGGYYQRFQNGYMIGSAATGTFVSNGPIRSRWGATGYETGYLGYPLGNTVTTTTGAYQKYQNGFILWSAASGAYSSMGGIRTAFASQGYEGGRLGYPTSEIYSTATGTAQKYQGGIINRTTAGVNTITYY